MAYGANAAAETRAREAAFKNFFQNVEVALRGAAAAEAAGPTEARFGVSLGVSFMLASEGGKKGSVYIPALGVCWGLNLGSERH
jgi:hypothetical protein